MGSYLPYFFKIYILLDVISLRRILSRFYIFNYILYIPLIIFLLNPLFLGSNEIEHVNSIIITLEGKELENGTKISASFKIIIVTDLIPEKIDWKDLTLSNYTIQGNILIKFPEKKPSGQYWTYSKIFYLHLENNKNYSFILFVNNKEALRIKNFNASLQTYETPYVYIYTTLADSNITTKTQILETRTTLSIKETTIFSTVYTTTTSFTSITTPTIKTEITTHTTTSPVKDTYIKNGYIIISMSFLVIFLIVFAFLIRLYKKRRIKVIKLDESELEYL